MFAFDYIANPVRLFKLIVLAISLVLLLIEIGLITAVITGRNDRSKLRHRIILLFGASIFVFLVGQICGAVSEAIDRGALQEMQGIGVVKEPFEFLIFVNGYERNARVSEAIFNIISALGAGASLIFWATMRQRLGLDRSNIPSTL
jgi:hypothetical protein